MVASGALRVSRRLREFPRCAGCGRRILAWADGGSGVVVARENGVRLGPRGARYVWRHVTFHSGCLSARVRWHRRRAQLVLALTGAGALAAAVGLWLAGSTLLPAALLAGLGMYAAYLEATDTRAVMKEP